MTDKAKKTAKHRIAANTPCVYSLKIELMPKFIQPPIWRRLDVDGRISFGKLHHFIQAAFGWSDSHLHQFSIHNTIYADPHLQEDDFEIKDERKAILYKLLAEEDEFIYTYDFGDDWQHIITVEHVITDESDLNGGAYITDGARACPPEDVGGADGYHDFLETILVNPHSEQAQSMRDWVGGQFDSQAFDVRLANAAICRIMYNKWGGK